MSEMIYSGREAQANKEKICGIYKITNLTNNKIYVGQSIDIFCRWRAHLSNAKDPKRQHNSLIDKSIEKRGIDNFSIEILELCQKEQLNEKELFYAKQLNSYVPNGYNIAVCGGAMVNRSRAKQVSSYDLDTCKRVKTYSSTREVERDIGLDHSQISACCRGKEGYTSAGGYYWAYGDDEQITPPYKPNRWTKTSGRKQTVYQYDLKLKKVINSYSSCKQAAIALDKNYNSSICRAANGELKTAYGYAWSYIQWEALPENYQALNFQLCRGETLDGKQHSINL